MTLDTVLPGHFSERSEVIAAYLFGSQAKVTARGGSDMDIAVLLDPTFDLESHFAYCDFKPVLDLLHGTWLRQIQEEGLADRYRGRYNALHDARRARERFEGSAEG